MQEKAPENLPPPKRQQIEEELDLIFKDLQSKHGDKYTKPQLQCWARMISSGKYEDTDIIPAFLKLDNQPKKTNCTTIADALKGVAVTIADAVTRNSPQSGVQQYNSQLVVIFSPISTSTGPTPGISFGRITHLRIKKLHQLRELQGLLEQNVLSKRSLLSRSVCSLIHCENLLNRWC